MFDVRFHLGNGQYYKHWQIKSDTVFYINPENNGLILLNCKLINHKKKAEKVFSTQKRNVCGYIQCQNYEIINKSDFINFANLEEIMYDPKISPFWRKYNDNNIYDNSQYAKLITNGRNVFIC